jgi:flagellar basal body rod protein FlgG
MLTGFYSGISGMLYNEQRLDVISHNTANVDTPGFRRSLLMLRTREEAQDAGSVHSSVAKRNPSTHGVQRTGVFQDHMRTGTLRQTGNAFDVAIPTEQKNAFFQVQDPTAPGGVLYTRNGSLSLGPSDPKNPNSPSVLYMSSHMLLDANRQPISVDPNEGPITIAQDGRIMQGELEVGDMAVFRFNKSNDPTQQSDANLQLLEQRGESMLAIPEQYQDQFNPTRLMAGEGGVSRLTLQGMKESSNVNMVEQMVEMMATTKATEANATAIRHHMDSLSKLFELVRS